MYGGYGCFAPGCAWWLCGLTQSDLVGFDFCGFFLGRFGLRFACFAASDFVCVW